MDLAASSILADQCVCIADLLFLVDSDTTPNYAIKVGNASYKGFHELEPMLQCLPYMCIFLSILVTGTDTVLFYNKSCVLHTDE